MIYDHASIKYPLKSELSVSEILGAWPSNIEIIPLVAWVKPRTGVFYCNGQNWHFYAHGFLEVRFRGLPSIIEDNALEALKEGKMDILRELPECSPVLSAAYRRNGKTDGISDQLMYDYARSIGSKFANLSEEDHGELLEEMIQEGILILPSSY